MRELTKKVQKALAESTAAAEEALGTMRTVKAFHAEDELSARFGKHLKEYQRLSESSALVYFPFSAITYTFLPYCASCLVLYYGGKLVQHDGLGSGELVSFVFYMQSLFSSFNSMGSIYVGACCRVVRRVNLYCCCDFLLCLPKYSTESKNFTVRLHIALVSLSVSCSSLPRVDALNTSSSVLPPSHNHLPMFTNHS